MVNATAVQADVCSAGLLAGLWEFPSKPLSVESPGLPYPDVLQDHGVQVLYASKKVNCGEVCTLNLKCTYLMLIGL